MNKLERKTIHRCKDQKKNAVIFVLLHADCSKNTTNKNALKHETCYFIILL